MKGYESEGENGKTWQLFGGQLSFLTNMPGQRIAQLSPISVASMAAGGFGWYGGTVAGIGEKMGFCPQRILHGVLQY